MTEREALKLTLAALKQIDEAMPFPVAKLAIMEAEKALAQPEQEPVAMTITGKLGNIYSFTGDYSLKKGDKIYTAPPQRTWVGLTDEEKSLFSSWLDHKTDDEVFSSIEAKLRSKNT